jgi:hypothetical protein
MDNTTKLPDFIKAMMLLTGLLVITVAMADTPQFDSACGTCHGIGNTGGISSIDLTPVPPVKDTSAASMLNSITPVPVPGHELQKLIYDFGGLPDPLFDVLAAELATLTTSPCTPPQTLVNGVCTTSAPPICIPPQTLVNGVCAIPPPPACDDSVNTALCVNQLHQLGSLGSADVADAKADIYKVSCPKPAVAISASVSGLTSDNPARISVQVLRDGVYTPVIVDATPGDGIASGRSARLAKGPGVYKVKINKEKSSVPGIVQYDATISCLDKRSRRVGANVVIMRNQ